MTEPAEEPTRVAPRRPPAAPSEWATITPIGNRLSERVRRPAPRVGAVDGALALDPGAGSAGVAALPAPPQLRVVRGCDETDDVQAWAARFAQAVVEVLGGDRPLSQLLRWTSQRVYHDLSRRLEILNRVPRGTRVRKVRPQVRSVHVFHPTPTTAEVSVHVRHGQRSRAMAARLEHRSGRWQCTVLQLG